MPALYGADVEGVEGILTTQTFDNETQPTLSQVLGFVELVSGWVRARLGDLATFTGTEQSWIVESARGVVLVGAAAMAEDAGHPSGAGPGSSGGYGSTLWERYRTALKDLEEAIGREDGNAGPGGIPARPAFSAPPPAVRRRTGF